jgi:hypothetical protein
MRGDVIKHPLDRIVTTMVLDSTVAFYISIPLAILMTSSFAMTHSVGHSVPEQHENDWMDFHEIW